MRVTRELLLLANKLPTEKKWPPSSYLEFSQNIRRTAAAEFPWRQKRDELERPPV